ncbi:hypothetical protein ACFSC4_24145 [Deinococcus malanensis]|uniref:hypothetical protein n=1 Tax=Deinococcus malanensis TaxID=1706855 RepID=UPI0036325C5E
MISTIPEWAYWVMGLGSISGLLGPAVQAGLTRRTTRPPGRRLEPDRSARQDDGPRSRPER